MAFNDLIRLGASAAGDDYEIDKSLRFNNDADTATLTRTFSSAGNRKTWTFSCWVKKVIFGGDRAIFNGGGSGSPNTTIRFDTDNSLNVFEYNSGYTYRLHTNRMFRDPGSWYHLVVVLDTTQSTADNRIKIYVNGAQETSFANRTNPAQDTDYTLNNNIAHTIGNNASSNYFSGYLAEIHFIDGTALDASSFGETKLATGQWIPKEYTGSHGTNGFYLPLSDKSGTTATTLGKDGAGSNNWTPNNFATHDVVPDTPTNNFPVQQTAQKYTNGSPSQGALNWGTFLGSGVATRMATCAVKGGKWFMEYMINSGYSYPGGSTSGALNFAGPTLIWPEGGNDWRTKEIAVPYSTHIYSNGSQVETGLAGMAQGDIMSFAIDCDNFTCDIWKNGSSYGSQVDWSGHTYKNQFFVGMQAGSGGSLWYSGQYFNYGQDSSFAAAKTAGNNSDANGYGDFSMAVPSGYLTLCSKNLADPTIEDPGKYFNTIIYTGNDSADRDITGVGFQPDFLWIKNRSQTDWHMLQDAVRGANKVVYSNTTDPEDTDNSNGHVNSFLADGFNVDAGASGNVNENGENYVAWNWKESASAGFDIVSWTGNGSNRTIAHNLGVAAEMVIVKRRDDSSHWAVWHKNLADGTKWLALNLTNAQDADATLWNSTIPTSSVISIGSNTTVNANSGTYIAYLFASVKGYSHLGKYVGNGSADGTIIPLDFKPAWIMMKELDDSGTNWVIYDNKRQSYTGNPTDINLYPNLTNAGGDSSLDYDFLSSGFKVRTTNAGINNANQTYIYLAMAEAPYKYANAH